MSIQSIMFNIMASKSDKKRDAAIPLPKGVAICADIRYAPHGTEGLLDVYYPEGTTEKLPTIVSIHGGGYVYGSKAIYQRYCMDLARRGFTVVNFNYRLAPRNRFPAPLEDTNAVMHWICAHCEAYHMDTDKVFLVGDSAGGQLAFQLLTMLTNEKYSAMFSFAPPAGIRFRACGLNCGCYFMPIFKNVPLSKVGKMFEAYFPEDYVPCIPSLKTHKYIKKAFPPAHITTSPNDYLRMMAPPLHILLRLKGVKSVLRIYGEKSREDIGHVFHLSCHLEEADRCNDDQCEFFRKNIVSV